MKPVLTRTLAALFLLLPVLSARAAEERAQPYIVLVGIDKYADAQIKPRTHAEADAQAMYDLFTNKVFLGVDPTHVKLLLGSADDKRKAETATHANILKAIHWATSSAKPTDLVVFAYFGSGAPLGERTCYFATDSTYKDRAKNAVASAEIEQEMEKLKSLRFCAFLDVNFKGFDSGKEAAPDLNLQNLYKDFLGKDKDKDDDGSIGRVLFLANRGLVPSLDVENHSAFAKVLLDGLKGAADKEGYEPDGLVTVDEIVTYLDKELPSVVRKELKGKDDREQTHFVLGGRSSHFPLTHNPAVYPKVLERLGKFEKIASTSKLNAEILDEGRNLLGRMPKLEAHRALRKDYQALADGKLNVDDFIGDRERILSGMKLRRTNAVHFAQKVMEAIEQVKDGYIKELNTSEMVVWAIKGVYQRIDEKIPADIKERLDNASSLRAADLTILLADVRERLGKREDLDKHKDIDHALQRMLSHLDPYTTYIDPETLSQFERDVRKNYSGIGIQIRKHAERDELLVVTPIKGSPAYKAGIKAGDIITLIKRDVDSDGNALDKTEVIETKGLPLNDAVKKVLGKPNTKVKLVVERDGKTFDMEITRATIELETVMGVKRTTDDNWDYMIDPENKIAYIRLTGFAGNTARDLSRVMAKLDDQGVKGVILDVRFNPGGLLRSAVTISDLFIDDGPIVSVRPRVGREEKHTGRRAGSYLNFPMVCLVNGGSASASEIVSACLQDHKRAVIMGERSYGKGSVQNIQPFDGGQLKLTIATFWRPSNKNLNKSSTNGKDEDEWGVTPDKDYILKLTRTEREALAEYQHDTEVIRPGDAKEKPKEFKDRQRDMAVEYLQKQIRTASK